MSSKPVIENIQRAVLEKIAIEWKEKPLPILPSADYGVFEKSNIEVIFIG